MKITRYNGNFVKCLAQLPKESVIVTARDGIKDRIKLSRQGNDSHYVQKGGWHPEGVVRVNGTNYWCLQNYAPTSLYPQKTLDANKSGRYLALDEGIKIGDRTALEVIPEIAGLDAKKLPENRRVLNPQKQETFTVDSLALGDVDIARFLARSPKLAAKYGKTIKDTYGISNVTFYQIPSNENNVAAGFWLHWLGGGNASGFNGDNRNFDIDDGSLFGGMSKASTPQGASVARNLPKASLLETEVRTALNQKRAFEYNGVLYVPVRGKSAVLKQ